MTDLDFTQTDPRTTTAARLRAAQVSTPDEARIAYLVSMIAGMDERIAKWQDVRASFVQQLLDATPDNGKHNVPGIGTFTISDNNTYDGDAFMAGLRPGQQRLVTSRMLDRNKAKSVYPKAWEAVKVNRGRKVSISLNK